MRKIMSKFIKVCLLTIFIANIMSVNTLADENKKDITVKRDKIWTITFNKTIEIDFLEKIKVKDSKDNMIDISLDLKEDNKVLIYPPKDGYNPLEGYTLIIDKSNNGLQEDFQFKFKVFDEIKSVNQILKGTFHKDKFELPKEVVANLINGEEVNVPVIWDKEPVTDEIGKFFFKGKVDGFDKKVNLTLHVFPKVISVKDINVELYTGDEYSLPEEVEVEISDGTTVMKKVNWTNNNLNIRKVGEYLCEGQIIGYDGLLKAKVTVKSGFLLERTFPRQNEENVVLKYGYMDIIFSRDTVESYDVDKIILKDENGVRIKIKRTQPGVDYRNNFLIIPSRPLSSNMSYTLFIPKGLIKSVYGEVYNEDIEITFKTK